MQPQKESFLHFKAFDLCIVSFSDKVQKSLEKLIKFNLFSRFHLLEWYLVETNRLASDPPFFLALKELSPVNSEVLYTSTGIPQEACSSAPTVVIVAFGFPSRLRLGVVFHRSLALSLSSRCRRRSEVEDASCCCCIVQQQQQQQCQQIKLKQIET